MKRYFEYSLLIICVLSAWGHWLTKDDKALPLDIGSECMLHVVLPDTISQQIVDYEGFIVSFNERAHIPNYSAWELTAVEADGNLPRKSKFHSDSKVAGCPTTDDYRNSGFDRGHIAPAADMKWSAAAMEDSHSMANICPQNHSVNSGVWSTIEKRCREWVRRDSAIIIIGGPVMSDVMPQKIGATGVSVPRRFFKVVLAPFANPPRSIAFIVPNYESSLPMREMVCTVDELEDITGYDFFSCLPDSIEDIVEAKADLYIWDKQKR